MEEKEDSEKGKEKRFAAKKEEVFAMKDKEDPWLASEDKTYTKEIQGKEVVFLADPPAKKINAISRRYRNNPDKGNYELVREIVVKPEITQEIWDTMSARVQGQLIQEILEIIGVGSPFLAA